VQAVKGDAMRNGKIYGLPLSLDVMGIYYNKDLLDRAGIPLPPKTWEEFQKDVEKLVKIDKNTNKIIQAGAALGTGANIPGSDDILYVLFQQSKVPFVNSSGQAVFNQGGDSHSESPAAPILNFYTDFANPTRSSYTWNDSMPNALDSFVNGSLAFFIGYSYDYPIIKARAPQLNFEVMPMLQISDENPVNVASYSLQTVLLKSKHPNEAWNVVDTLTHSTAVKGYLDRTNRPTALRYYIGDQQTKPELAPFLSQALVANNWYRGNNYPAAQKAVQDIFGEWLTPSTAVSPEEWMSTILNRAVQKINQTN
jgi:ABC-type glycerol-3-phosphate transport system substrate-binding protein